MLPFKHSLNIPWRALFSLDSCYLLRLQNQINHFYAAPSSGNLENGAVLSKNTNNSSPFTGLAYDFQFNPLWLLFPGLGLLA